MSYSFTVRAATKEDVIEGVVNEFDKIVVAQNVHSQDREQAQAAVEAFVNLLVDDYEHDVSVVVNGSIWQAADGIRQAAVSVTASTVDKVVA